MMTRLLMTLAVTAPGGLLFAWLHMPLSWMLGPLTAAVLWQSLIAGADRPLVWPVACRNGGLLLLGYAMGLAFTADSAARSRPSCRPWRRPRCSPSASACSPGTGSPAGPASPRRAESSAACRAA
ncbi:hypothetical protein [Paenibacillus mucilaginosus]|uniref:hypothetical protein n=1 Tax=Paenibacillus mucilaginosus TaxID=61624 RepID=UPI00240E9836|nr:hypothetical protein [Paenibacillus mucilaginosus]